MNFKISLFFKGMLMGIAEIIPGVSGGTLAFITGIYQELINSIKSINIIVSYIADVILEAKGGNKDNSENELESNSIELEEESK
mgnify:CR=1 FL=1